MTENADLPDESSAAEPVGSRRGPWQFRLRSVLAVMAYLCLWLAASRAVLSGLPGDRIWPDNLPAWTAVLYAVWTGVAVVQLGAFLLCIKYTYRRQIRPKTLLVVACWSFAPSIQWSVTTVGIIKGIIRNHADSPEFMAVCFLHLAPLGVFLLYQRFQMREQPNGLAMMVDAAWVGCMFPAAASLPLALL